MRNALLPTCQCFLILAASLSAAAAEERKVPAGPPAETIAKWRQMKLGMFIHWGPVSVAGAEIGWSRGRVIPIQKYDNLYKQFNPVKFDAEQWVGYAKQAGMKYIVHVGKHADGFCMFDTKQTEYNVMNSPFKRDIVGEMATACRKAGMPYGVYYCVGDWWHADFPHGSPGGRTLKPNANIDRYERYMCKQVEELVHNYGPLLTLWFDYGQDFDAVRGRRVTEFVRALQPDMLLNDRVDWSRENLGDYDTPEQKIGKMQTDRPWETCMTIVGTHWSWAPNDPVKSLKECVQTLVKVVGGDGNLLLNIGPMPDGRFEPLQVERLHEIGQWLAKYGESIYGTRGGPFQRAAWGAATYKGDTIYLHLLDPNLDAVKLPPIARKIVASSTLTGGTPTVKQTEEGIEVSVPAADRQEIDSIVVLKLDGPVK
jgi:alpha-L-fucosidase